MSDTVEGILYERLCKSDYSRYLGIIDVSTVAIGRVSDKMTKNIWMPN